jgi:DNA-binding NarL/FixJ family response regulator
MRLTHKGGHDSRSTHPVGAIRHGAVYKGADMRVFVVEDSAPIRERLIEMIVEIDGFEVVGQAATFNEAISGIRRTQPDVAIFDIQLAAGTGIDALAEAKRERPGLRAIVLTNYATPQHEKASIDAGAEYFLDKSADFEKIAEILDSMKADRNNALKPAG